MINFIIALLLLLLPTPVLAGSLFNPVEPVLAQTTQPSEVTQLRQSYNQHLEVYRNQEKSFQIAFDQHQSLNTLASLDELLLKTKELAITRDLVLIDYFNLLQLNLQQATGVELSLKTQYLQDLELNLTFLDQHRQQLSQVATQEQLRSSLSDFANLVDPEGFSQEILALLALAKLQNVYDLVVPLKADVDTWLVDQGVADSPSNQRATAQVEQTLQQANNQLNSLWLEAAQARQLSGIYDNLTEKLNPSYVALSQTLIYLTELTDFN